MQIFMKIDHKKNRTLFFFMPLVNVFAADCTVQILESTYTHIQSRKPQLLSFVLFWFNSFESTHKNRLHKRTYSHSIKICFRHHVHNGLFANMRKSDDGFKEKYPTLARELHFSLSAVDKQASVFIYAFAV